MVLETITFKVQEKQKKDFKGKCEKNEVSMYSALKWLIDKYVKNEVTQNATTAGIEALQKQLDEEKNQHKRETEELKQQIEGLRKDRASFNIQTPDNIGTVTRIIDLILKITSRPNSEWKLDSKDSDFCFKFLYRNEKQI